jgi:transposase
MRAYSEDLRKKIVATIEHGMSKAQAARLFGVSPSSVKRYSRMAREGGSLEPRKSPGRPRKADEKARVPLEKEVEERPSATIGQRRRFLERITDTTFSDSTVRRCMKRLGFSQKRTMGALERDEFLRCAWKVTIAKELDPRRLVFVDEMGTNTSLSALYAWAPKGERAHCSVPRNRGPNTTLLSSMTLEGMGSSLAVEGATTAAVFGTYVERILASSLEGRQVVVMDNHTAHEGERVKELIEQRDCELLYLPPYSPDFDPIEEAFCKIKGMVRKVEARTREALVEAIGMALSAVIAREARGFFEHCGYRATVQLF